MDRIVSPSTPNLYVETNSQCWDGGILNLCNWWPYKKEKRESSLSVSFMWGSREKPVICKPGRELSPEADYAGTLKLDFWPPELWENEYLLFNPSRLWYFLMVVSDDQYNNENSVLQNNAVEKDWHILMFSLKGYLSAISDLRWLLCNRVDWIFSEWGPQSTW